MTISKTNEQAFEWFEEETESEFYLEVTLRY